MYLIAFGDFQMYLVSFKRQIALVLCTAVSGVMAHVTLEQAQFEANAMYKAVMRVPHGCESLPTTALRVQLPAGFQGAKPMPKVGWVIQTKKEKLTKPYDNHGKQVTEDVTEITWTAQSPEYALRDSEYGEFIFRGRAAMPVGAAWFKVRQLCREGEKEGMNSWTEIPAQGTSTRGLKFPAALLHVHAPAPAPAAHTQGSAHTH